MTVPTMDWFVPVLLLSLAIIAAFWLTSNFYLIGGWKGILTYVSVLFGVRIDLLRRQRLKQKRLHEATVAWVEQEVSRVYDAQNRWDPSGSVFKTYANLFSTLATLDQPRLDALSEKYAILQRHRPIVGVSIPNLLKELDRDMAYNSNAIEGNPISKSETTIILAGYTSSRGRRLRDVLDIVGHHKAFGEIVELASQDTPLTLDHILTLHKLVLFDSEAGGVLRSGQELAIIRDTKVLLALPHEVKQLVTDLIDWINQKRSELHPLLLAVNVHSIFVRIHPFKDGNGRLARLLSNFVFLQAGYPVIVVPCSEKAGYIHAIKCWQNGDARPLTNFTADLLDDSFKRYFRALRVER